MKEYDFKSIKRYVQMHSDLIDHVKLGMKEDWWWTAETIYEDLKFTVDLDKVNLEIAGINGSFWATPVMFIKFKDGTEKFKDAYIGESDEQKPEWFQLGCMSGPAQDWVDTFTPKLTVDN